MIKLIMRYRLFRTGLILLFLFLSSDVFAQNYQESIKIADEAYGENDFYTASVYYNNAMWHDSSDLKVAFKCAESYRLFNNYEQAMRWYRYVLNNDTRKQWPLSRFWLAMMQKSLGQYDKALINFRAYFNENKDKADTYYIDKSKVEIQACQEAPAMLAQKKNVLIEHLNESSINTSFSEFNAVQLSDTALVFSALRPLTAGDFDTYIPSAYLSKIYITQTTVAGWGKAGELDVKINDKKNHNANICFSDDYTKVFFTRAKSDENKNLVSEIYYTEFKNNSWQNVKRLSDKINVQGYTSTHPHYAEFDGFDILFYVSDRPGGIGKLDIWYCIIKEGKYQDPINLGSIINSPGDDITPFYYKENQTLYFSSDWHKGLGGFDIFYSKGLYNSWTKPVNIGYPVNGGCNDLYFVVNDIDKDGFLTSNRPGSLSIKSETCCYDIYSYEWQDTTTIKTEVQPAPDTVNIVENIRSMLPLTLYFHNDEPDPKSTNTSTKRNYQTLLGEYYMMKDIYSDEYSKGLSGSDKTKAQKNIIDFFENYVAQGFTQLKLFAKLLHSDLQRGNSVKIIIKGYCSPLNTTEYNLNLSMRRISSIVNYLKQYYEGVLMEYINGTAGNGAKLTIVEEPLGKSTASPLVSDNPNDKRNSIYSRAAALERKVQIILYESENADLPAGKKQPEIAYKDSILDFGNIKQGEEAMIYTKFKNTGTAALMISGVETSCGCIMVDWPRDAFAPGKEGELKISFNTNEDMGVYNELITIYTNTAKGKYVFQVKAVLSSKN